MMGSPGKGLVSVLIGVPLATHHISDNLDGSLLSEQTISSGSSAIELGMELDHLAVSCRDQALEVSYLQEGLATLGVVGVIDVLDPNIRTNEGKGELLVTGVADVPLLPNPEGFHVLVRALNKVLEGVHNGFKVQGICFGKDSTLAEADKRKQVEEPHGGAACDSRVAPI